MAVFDRSAERPPLMSLLRIWNDHCGLYALHPVVTFFNRRWCAGVVQSFGEVPLQYVRI